jgi:uridine phosphorylase
MPQTELEPYPDLPPAIHLHPTGPLADRVLLPGDPGRAMRLAQHLIDQPRMFNHNRGLWGYSGPARHDGKPLTIQSTGMGGPSAAIIVSELIDLGARTLVRVGTCGGLDPELQLGQLLVVSEAIADDGTSQALGAPRRVQPSPALLSRLRSTGSVADGPAVSTDLFYDAAHLHDGWRSAGARVVEMECATVFAVAHRRGVDAAAALLVSDTLVPAPPVRIGPDDLYQAELRLGELAVAALAAA